MVGVARIERATLCLKGRCSTTELHTHVAAGKRFVPILRIEDYGLHAAPFLKKYVLVRQLADCASYFFKRQ